MKIHNNFLLSQVLWYKIGGKARYFIETETKEDIISAFEYIRSNNIEKFFVVGLGSNLLFTDDYYDGVVVQITSGKKSSIQVDKNLIHAFAGEELDSVIKLSLENNLVGIEWAGGLPGTVGAAIRGNVGAFGGEIKTSFHSAEVIQLEGKKFSQDTLNKRDIRFSYRNSTVKKKKNIIVLSTTFELTHGTSQDIEKARQTYFANIEYRKERHPLDLPNTGSVFKNVNETENVEKVLEVFPDIEDKVRTAWHGKVSMGYLIKRLELAGLRIGNAQISQKHSNFIVNLGGARFTDVLGIIHSVQNKFVETFGFSPEPEVEIVQ